MKSAYLISWHQVGFCVRLKYSDGETLLVLKSDFDRAFGPIVSGSKDDIRRDFALSFLA